MQRVFCFLLVASSAACLPDVTITDPAVQLRCEDEADCPDDFACKDVDGEGRCIALAVLSKTPLTITTPLSVTTPRVGARPGQDRLEATVTFNEAPLALDVDVDGQTLTCTADDAGIAYVCALTVSDAVPVGQRTVALRARDAAANVVIDSATVIVDRAGPTLLRTDVLEARPGEAFTIAPGDTATFAFVFDEPIRSLVIDDGAGGACDEPAIEGARATCVFTAGNVEGAHAITGSVSDDLENTAALDIDDLFIVDATAPGAPDVAGEGVIVYERAPWGAGDNDRARFTLTSTAAAVEAGARLAVFGDEAGTQLLAVGAAGASLDLGGVDRAVVHVAAVDAAGNRSAIVPVREQRWTATLGNKVGTRRFENPHQVFAVDDVTIARERADDRELDAAALDPGADGAVVAPPAARARLITSGALPPDRADPCLAFDRARGAVVLFGGRRAGTSLNDTWLFLDGRWRQETPATSPAPRDRAACVWDPLRDRVVLVGGRTDGGAALDEIWEWDGLSWARAGNVLPAPVVAPAAAFDEHRLGVVVIGGEVGGSASDAVTVIDGTGVTVFSGPRPPARSRASAVGLDGAEVVDGGVLLFGGTDRNDTWRLGPDGFVEVAATPPGVDVDGAVLAVVAGDVILQTGLSNATFRLDGTVWSPVVMATSAGARVGHRLVGRDDDAIVMGGAILDDGTAQRLTLNGSGGRFTAINAGRIPTGAGVQIAYDTVARVVVAVDASGAVFLDDGSSVISGGRAPAGTLVDGGAAGALGRPLIVGMDGSVAAFDGRDFVSTAVAAVVPPSSSARVTRAGDAVVLVNANETWRLVGTSWQQLTSPNPSVTTTQFAVAGLLDRVVTIGDDTVAILEGDTWTTTTMVGPARRTNTVLVTDREAGRVIMFGGFDSNSALLGDLWAFDGSTFTAIDLDGGPSARAGHAMAFDRRQGEVLLVGGAGDLDEVWRIDTGLATQPALRLAISVAASQVPVATLRDITVDADGGFASLSGWRLGAWVPFDDDPTPAAWLSGDENTLHLLLPTGAPGTAASLDTLDVTFTFRSN